MKNFILSIAMLVSMAANAQQPKANTISVGGGASFTGFAKDIKGGDSERGFDIEHAMVNVKGAYYDNKVSFFIQADFVESFPILDAFVAVKATDDLTIKVGQQKSVANTRERMLIDYATAFATHSKLSGAFSRSGRELGIFADYRLPSKSMGLDLGAAITSGEGRNAFQQKSEEHKANTSGLKYGARATFYPMGYMSKGNDMQFFDLSHENFPKLAIGVAASYNDGASSAQGEGKNEFTLYNKDSKVDFASYTKVSADIMFKWNGFTLLADWQTTSAGDKDLYATPYVEGVTPAVNINERLAIGSGFDVQAGYVTKDGWAFAASYSNVKPKENTAKSATKKQQTVEAAVSKYLYKNNIRIQLAGEWNKYDANIMPTYKDYAIKANLIVLY